MPTAGRLAGAIIFALFGWYMAEISARFFPDEIAPDFWIPGAAIISLLIGWRVCGIRAGRGYNPAVGIGLTASAAMAFCLIFALAFMRMIDNAMRLRYNGPMDAVVNIFVEMLEYGTYFYDLQLIATLLIGGVVCAWVTEFFGQRFS
ncbi:MAG: hypothetical protein ACJAVT_002763 [Yoonia sp.]|jgi:hypothetical protein